MIASRTMDIIPNTLEICPRSELEQQSSARGEFTLLLASARATLNSPCG